MDRQTVRVFDSAHRRSFIGGSDARVIMGTDEAALLRLWREKRGEIEPDDLSGQIGKNTYIFQQLKIFNADVPTNGLTKAPLKMAVRETAVFSVSRHLGCQLANRRAALFPSPAEREYWRSDGTRRSRYRQRARRPRSGPAARPERRL
jgi:hypothetical protein